TGPTRGGVGRRFGRTVSAACGTVRLWESWSRELTDGLRMTESLRIGGSCLMRRTVLSALVLLALMLTPTALQAQSGRNRTGQASTGAKATGQSATDSDDPDNQPPLNRAA